MAKATQPKDLGETITEHMGQDVTNLPIIKARYALYNGPNVYRALERYISTQGNSAVTFGISGAGEHDSLAELVAPQSVKRAEEYVSHEGPIAYKNMDLCGEESFSYARTALYLITGERRIAVVLRQGTFHCEPRQTLDALAETSEIAEQFIAVINQLIDKTNIYRSKVLAFDGSEGLPIKFVALPNVSRDRIILPDGLLKRIERQTIDATVHADALRRAGLKVKRGILLHGKPGTGKTLTAKYLASAMKDRTVITVAGFYLNEIQGCFEIARWLQPAVVIIEDADLIAEAREHSSTTRLLSELLNQMDGLGDDADILFVLTTNRPGVLEPALAARPGRVDQAYEIPLPDADCRRRLFELYGAGLKVEVKDLERFINRTNGCSGAFICELLRKAALFAAPEGEPICVTDKHLDEAMHELIVAGGKLTKSLLGSYDIGFVA